MERPTDRPNRPMTYPQVFEKLRQHFVTDKGQRCFISGSCEYSGHGDPSLGCFIGILLTEADAAELDTYRSQLLSIIKNPTRAVPRDILEHYIDLSDAFVVSFLMAGQLVHDTSSMDNIHEHMSAFFSAWLKVDQVAGDFLSR